MIRSQGRYRRVEAFLMVLVLLIAALGFWLASAAARLQAGEDPLGGMPGDLLPLLPVAVMMLAVHILLNVRRSRARRATEPETDGVSPRPSAQEESERAELRAQLTRALATLPQAR